MEMDMALKQMADTCRDGKESAMLSIFNAALSGICANPAFFGPVMQGSPNAAVEFATKVTIAATQWTLPNAK